MGQDPEQLEGCRAAQAAAVSGELKMSAGKQIPKNLKMRTFGKGAWRSHSEAYLPFDASDVAVSSVPRSGRQVKPSKKVIDNSVAATTVEPLYKNTLYKNIRYIRI